MKIFLEFVDFLVAISVVLTAVQEYLVVNKLWTRKHEKNIAESISVLSISLGSMVSVSFLAKAILLGQFSILLSCMVKLISYTTRFSVGIGVWVKENRGQNVWKLVLKAFNLERKEANDLVKSLIMPTGAKEILILLSKIAAIDNEMHKEEVKLLHEFASKWNIELPDLKTGEVEDITSLLDVRQATINYLNTSPPSEQASQLIDLITLLVKADHQITKEEELILAELGGMLNDYTSKSNENVKLYEVLIIPQNESQFMTIQELFSQQVEIVKRRGGKVAIVGIFYSEDYAEAISQKYINLSLCSIVHRFAV